MLKRKDLILFVCIFVLSVILSTLIVCTPNPFFNIPISNDWIGYYGSFMGAFVSGVITLYVMARSTEEGRKNLEKSIKENNRIQERNERISFCNDIAKLISEYCSESREQRYASINMERTCREKNYASEKLINYEFNKKMIKEGIPGYKIYNEPEDLIKREYDRASDEFNKALEKMENINTINLLFELDIKLKNAKGTEILLEKIKSVKTLGNLNVQGEDDIIKKSNEVFEDEIICLLDETTNFIDEYVNRSS